MNLHLLACCTLSAPTRLPPPPIVSTAPPRADGGPPAPGRSGSRASLEDVAETFARVHRGYAEVVGKYQRIAERLLSAERVPDFLSSFIGQLKNLTSDLAWVPRCARGGAVREKRMREMQNIEKQPTRVHGRCLCLKHGAGKLWNWIYMREASLETGRGW